MYCEGNKLERQRSNEITKKEKMIDHKLFRDFFEYSSPSNMYKKDNKQGKKQESSKYDKKQFN